ncbi:O-antigen ligase domain-containing protein [Halobacteria archaeon AArc-dxtr1]|nr:O-antigen ligase domain-containing protein [Halobacteria archaeon AArc-dxtr1]
MSEWRSSDMLWGRSSADTPTVPFHYALLAVLTVLVAIAPSTWLLSTDRGYLLSGAMLVLIVVYGVVFTSVSLSTNPTFVALFGGYWLWLVAHYWRYDPHPELLSLILSTPVAVFATVVVLPRFVDGRRQTFAMGLALSSAVVAVIGIWMLLAAGTAGSGVSDFVGEDVMGLYPIRTVSVFTNPNPYGFFMMVGCLAALYTVLVRGGVGWILVFGLCLLGLVMSEGDAALVGFSVGAVLVLSGRHHWLSYLGIGFGIVALYGMIRVGHVPEVMRTTLMNRVDRWVRSLDLLAANPLWGIGFAEVGSEIGIGREFGHSELFPPLSADTGTSSGPHSSYVYPLLSTGLLGGVLYLGSLGYALGCGIRRRWTSWRAFVVGTASGIYVYMIFESHFLGGLGVSSVVFGLFVGLMLLPDADDSDPKTNAVTARDALATSRAVRAVTWIRTNWRDRLDSLPRS